MGRKAVKTQLNIFRYNDFRLFLKDLIKEYKERHPKETMRSLASHIGFGSPSFLKMIIDGQRKMTLKSFDKLCQYLHIQGREKDYFKALVDFSQVHDPDKKRIFSEKLKSLRPRVTFSELKKNQNKYLTNDYFACIREMVLLKEFKEDPKWIAAKCLPRIKPAEAREAIEVLLELKLLSRDQNGKLIQSETIVDTGDQVEAIEAFAFHEAVLNKARKYLTHLDQNNRNFSALTIPIPHQLENVIIKKLYDFQNEILDLINAKGIEYDDVYQLNFQFFPVSTQQGEVKSKDENNDD
ncbi:hypothetical protein BVY03_03865 [bacterium K02(2017)]|nr:hypothetical protein BVY03_03865 [bacterium K02(2017)]